MSGIAGIIHFDGKPVEPGLIEKMTGAMAHRGPDGINHWRKGSVALGQCMLRTTPESLEEHLPLTNEDESLVLVMDGRVDNREDLRRELLVRGAVPRNRSDAELVLRAYEVWGEECPDRIIGEFAFFIWDARERRLFAARDAAGTRHFYYHAGNGWFGFASEIKGILALGRFEPQLNESRLLDYLVVEFDRDDEVGTFYQGINRLPAGHAERITKRGVKTWRYWHPGDLSTADFSSLDECAEGFLEQLRIAVKCRLRSIGPVGAMLSGGLDSSAIVGLISKEFQDDLAQPLHTFSLIREDRQNCPDWLSIREILKDEWLEPTTITSAHSPQFFRTCLNNMPNVDEPFAFSHGYTNSLVYEEARKQNCRIVLDGIAGDLLFYGADRTLDSIFRRKNYQQIPAMLAGYRRHGVDGGLRKLARKVLASATPKRARFAYRKLRDNFAVPGADLTLLRREIASQFVITRRNQRNLVSGHLKNENDQILHARIFTTGLLSFAHEVYGQIALSNGVEPRSPLSDRRIIEFAIRMPTELKSLSPWYKHLLRKSMDGILPEKVRWRHDIGGHPGWKFYEQAISDMVYQNPNMWDLEHLSSILRRWIDGSSLRREWRKYAQTADYPTGFNLYTIVILAQWLSVQPNSMQPRQGSA